MSLSNIGDVVLTLPVLDVLRASFPLAEISIVVGPKAESLFDENPNIVQVIAYDKKLPLRAKFAWLGDLRRQRFDLVVDLRNSFLPFLLNAAKITPPSGSRRQMHMTDKHLARLALVLSDVDLHARRAGVVLSAAQRRDVDVLVRGWNNYVLVALGAADRRKRWDQQGFLGVIQYICRRGRQVVLVGDKNDALLSAPILKSCPEGVIDLCGRTSLSALSGVIERAGLALTNDSGVMHLASYFDKPVIALFGPTDPALYGPWSSRTAVIRKSRDMSSITLQDVIAELDRFL